MKFTPEQLAKAKTAKSAEELIALAKENSIELTEEEAKKFFAELNKEGALADDELDNVSGGCGRTVVNVHYFTFECPFCGQYSQIKYTLYDNHNIEYSPDCCSCGARIKLFSTTSTAVYIKNGQEITVHADSQIW